jgi:hypothetical protein
VSAGEPRFRPLSTSRRSGGYAGTPARGGRGLHPHGKLRYEVQGGILHSRSTQKPKVGRCRARYPKTRFSTPPVATVRKTFTLIR